MTTLQQRTESFAKLGEVLAEACSPSPGSSLAAGFRKTMDSQEQNNKWFTADNVKLAISSLAGMLQKKKLDEWLSKYELPEKNDDPKTIAVIMAGNIPAVGFHDFLTALISGNNILARTSSKDDVLIKHIADILIHIEPAFEQKIRFTDKITDSYDAIIATGSNNTLRYFEHYFGHKPHIFRQNRNSVAIINRNTTENDIRKLADDVFSYFGLGCRNVSMIYLEENVPLSFISNAWKHWSHIINHNAYANNYLYNKSILNINKQKFTDTGFCLLVPSGVLSSPVSVIHYSHFRDMQDLNNILASQSRSIQCIVSNDDTGFGKTQQPAPDEYADNMDTMTFFSSL